MNPTAPIVLLTDYGTQDPYVGILKGVITGIAPGIPVIDLTHEIQPGDRLQAAVTLWASRPYFPEGTVFCCVVDPGVGTDRRAILVESGNHRFIGPDNGLFTFVTEEHDQAWVIEAREYIRPALSRTFHGRDVFAPAAAYAALGKPGNSFGRAAETLARLLHPLLQATEINELDGEILFADRFGNLLTSLGAFVEEESDLYVFMPWLKSGQQLGLERCYLRTDSRLVLPSGQSLDWIRTFAEKPPGEFAFLVGSSGLLEVVANQKSAEQLLGLSRGDRVMLLSGDQD